MRIGFMGMGELGLPMALAVEQKGHAVVGHDPSDVVKQTPGCRKLQAQEVCAQDCLDTSKIRLVPIPGLVSHSKVIYVGIESAHDPKYEGTKRMPEERKDFDHRYLVRGINDLTREIGSRQKSVIVVIISTVLPGTIRREIKPIVEHNPYLRLC